ncbi:MAG TPA: hypothetical protein VMV41_11030 [Cellulomonadaceae bacterium]|nr:hypothetical protein [Cellulomonadaceae bacterium]
MNDVVGRGTLLSGRYRVLQSLPSSLPGSSAWTASDQILDRSVHVSIIAAGNVSQALDAARRAALVADPRLVRILDVGDHEGVGYVVSEQVRGPSLAELVATGPLPADQARALIGEAASALEVARRRGVHHLALRPSALHVTASGGVVLTGIAVDGVLLNLGIGDARSTTRADTVGLVRLLYTALTGRWPVDPTTGTLLSSGVQAAPVVQGAAVPPADLVAGVPNDLDTLCAVTLGPNDDGPHSPAELVGELEPWRELRAGELLGHGAAGTLHDVAPIPVAPERPAGTIERQSVRSTLDSGPSAGTDRPGTPPPAIPPRSGARRPGATPPTSGVVPGAPTAATPTAPPLPPTWSVPPPAPLPHVGPGSAASASGSAGSGPAPSTPTPSTPTPSTSSPAASWPGALSPAGLPAAGSLPPAFPPSHPRRTPVLPPVGSSLPPEAAIFASPRPSFDALVADDAPLVVRRFDPTRLVLAIVTIAVVIGIVIAFKGLFSPIITSGAGPAPAPGATTPSATPSATPTTPAPSQTTAAPAGGAPVIASVASVNPPPGTGPEHPESVGLAIDSNPATFWTTSTYAQANMGGKPGVGFAITLAKTTTVSAVTLHINGSGGNVEVRATDAANPTTGPVLASGPMGADTVLTFSKPVETQTIMLWFTLLPQTADGSNRVELNEVTVS